MTVSIICDPVKGCGPGPRDFASVSVDRGLHTFGGFKTHLGVRP
jgi:hypothetical protein